MFRITSRRGVPINQITSRQGYYSSRRLSEARRIERVAIPGLSIR